MAVPLIYQMNIFPSSKSANETIKNKDATFHLLTSSDHPRHFDKHCLPSCVGTRQDKSSKSIPILNHIHRTHSERQLQEDEAVADYRDYCMYQRIVSGIVKKQQEYGQPTYFNHQHPAARQDEDIIRSIIRTRHSPIREEEQHQDQLPERQKPVLQWPQVQPRTQQLPVPHCKMDYVDDDFALSYDDMETISIPLMPPIKQTGRQLEDEIFEMDL